MRLPRPDQLRAESEKVAEYLMNVSHRHGASKAWFFARFGFRLEQWEVLAEALRRHGAAHEVTRTHQTPFGPRFEVEGRIVSPDGRNPRLRTVWQWDDGEVAPRLITAYPLEPET